MAKTTECAICGEALDLNDEQGIIEIVADGKWFHDFGGRLARMQSSHVLVHDECVDKNLHESAGGPQRPKIG